MRIRLLFSLLLIALVTMKLQAQELTNKTLQPFDDEISLKVPDGEDWLFTTAGSSDRYKEFKVLNSKTPGQVYDARITGRLYYPATKEEMQKISLNYLSKISYRQLLSKENMRMDKSELANGERVAIYNIHTEPFEHRGEKIELRAKVYLFARKVEGKAHLYFITVREASREKYHFSGKYFPQLEELLETVTF